MTNAVSGSGFFAAADIHVGAQFGDIEAGHHVQQIVGVCPDVSDDRTASDLCRVLPPCLSGAGLHVTVLQIFDMDLPNVTDHALGNHPLGLPDHCMVRIGIGHDNEPVFPARQADQLVRVFDRRCHRLVENDIDPGIQERLRDLGMAPVGCADRNRVDPVGSRSFRLGHLPEVGIASIRRDHPVTRRHCGVPGI